MIASITLNDGTAIPQLGFGTLNVPPDRTPSPENTATTAEVVGLALQAGYRLIDTAQMYGNERGVGHGIAASGLPRQELYVTSKLGNGNHCPSDVRRSFDQTLDKLGLDYLDLFLMHWPLPTRYDGDYTSTWEAMTELLAGGRLRSAGVSNFQPAHLDRIVDQTGAVPAVNQIEVHPASTTTPPGRHQPATASRWRPGARSARARCSATRPSSRSPPGMAHPPPRSSCAGTSSTATLSWSRACTATAWQPISTSPVSNWPKLT